MPCFLIIAHAPLASALRSVALHAFAERAEMIHAVDVEPGASLSDVEALARAALEQFPEGDVLVLTDVFGATPCNVAQRLAGQADTRQVKVIAGVNVPMMWRTLCYAQEPMELLIARAMAGATQGVMQVATSRPQNQTFKATVHDQDDDDHQQ